MLFLAGHLGGSYTVSQKAHFWLTAGAITLTEAAIGAMTEEEARQYLAERRWGHRDKQVCPDCGAVEAHYEVRNRNQWRCKQCTRTFSVTSGTPFHKQKIGYRKLLLAICAFVNHHKGLAALELRRIIGAHYRTCYVLLQKLRAVILLTADLEKCSGVVDIDGAHFSGKRRKPARKNKPPTKEQKNEVPKRYGKSRSLGAKDRPHYFPFHRNRRIVMVLRQVSLEQTDRIDYRNGKRIGRGAQRTIVEVCRSENPEDCIALIEQYVAAGSTVRTDAHIGYGNLDKTRYHHQSVNHSEEFISDEGWNQNQAESFFARLRRSSIGIYHRIFPKYMKVYGLEMAWREDIRRMDTRCQVDDLLKRAFSCGILWEWINYCRGNSPKKELLYRAPPPRGLTMLPWTDVDQIPDQRQRPGELPARS